MKMPDWYFRLMLDILGDPNPPSEKDWHEAYFESKHGRKF